MPIPIACPSTAAMRGLGKVLTARRNLKTGLVSSFGGSFRKSNRSLPAVKLPPEPCKIATRTEVLLAALLSASVIPSYISRVSAFFFSGRFSAMRRMLSLMEMLRWSLMVAEWSG